MKKFLLTIAVLIPLSVLVYSCNNDDDDYYDDFTLNKLVVDSVDVVNDTMQVYSVQSIRTYGHGSSGCDHFYGYDYNYTNDSVRTVTAIMATYGGTNCTLETPDLSSQFNFQPRYKGNYTFKFWNGTDSSGNDVWLTKKIVVQ